MPPSTPNKSHTPHQAYISFSGGLRLLGEDWFLAELAPLGLTRRGFRRLCTQLSVPTIQIGSQRVVDFFAFMLAFRHATWFGAPNTYLPGTPSRARRNLRPISATPSELAASFDTLVNGMVASRRVFGLSSGDDLRDAAASAVRRSRNHTPERPHA